LREQELRQGEDRLRATLTAALDCIMVTDHAGRIIEFNPAAEACFGHTRQAVLGRRLIDALIPEHLQAAHERELARYFDSGAAAPLRQRMELLALRADGTEFPAELAIGTAQGPEGPIFIAYLRDISERKAAEEKRLQLESRLRQAQKMEAIGQLTGGIAHDFNNLLTSITGYVVLASERPSAAPDPRLKGYLAHAQRSCDRARDLIQQMLVFSRGGQGSPCTLPLQPLIVEALPSVRAVLPPAMQMTLDVDDASTALVHVDPLQAEQVLLNLCLNARDAMGSAGELRVGLHPVAVAGLVCSGCGAPVDGSYVELAVADSGHGIAPETMQRMFDPFYSTKAAGKGTGMGLAIVHGIVHEHGGHVVVETRIGAGSCFRILWPAIAGTPQVGQASARGTSSDSPPRPALNGHVLVVDDDTSVAGFMRDLLETNGLEVTCAFSGNDALQMVATPSRCFDAVLTDQLMPGMSGVELARSIKAERPDLPVVLYTGYAEGLAHHDLESAGLDALLHKPVDVAALLATLARVMRQGGDDSRRI
jgi:PAS domain S-box-containing protein